MLDWRNLKAGDKLIYTVEEFGKKYSFSAVAKECFDDHAIAVCTYCDTNLWIDDWSAHMFRRDI